MTTIKFEHQMDAKGLFCPEPVMMLHDEIRNMAIGEAIEIQATDPSTKRDFIKFCSFLGHELIMEEERDGVFFYGIRKSG